jgi:hypothetical protein
VTDGGAATNDPCDGIMPASMDNVQTAAGDYEYSAGSDDLTGRVALGRGDPSDPSRTLIDWDLYPTDQGAKPSPVASFKGQDMFPTGAANLYLASQPQGFTGISYDSGSLTLSTWSHDGALEHQYIVAHPQRDSATFAIDPNGGTGEMVSVAEPDGSWHLEYMRFDKTGLLVTTKILGNAGAAFQLPHMLASGINLAGDFLLIFDDLFGTHGMWIRPDGTEYSEFDTTVSPLNLGTMQFMTDGRLALQQDGGVGWAWAWQDLATQPDAAPAWLTAPEHRFSSFYAIRGGRGMAVGNPDAPGLDLYSTSGKLCGQLPAKLFYEGAFSVGRDGTVIAADSPPRWWPQLLQ